MGLTYITVTLKNLKSDETYTEEFLVDTGATDSLVPANKLRELGIEPVGFKSYELADGTMERYAYGLAEISFMDEITAGRVIFGPDEVPPFTRGNRSGVSGGGSRSSKSDHQAFARDLS